MGQLQRTLFAILISVSPVALRAQTVPTPSLDATIGIGGEFGGAYSVRGGRAAAAVFVVPLSSGLIAGGIIGGQARVGGDLCLVPAHQPPACAPNFPNVAYGALLFGGAARAPGLELRAMAGPGYYGMSGGSGVGAQGQIDAALGFSHLALVGAARGSALRRFRGENVRLASFELGIRAR